ncbi:MAG: non-lysosomal glucosylceramidase, partial [Chloroflexota bacterium]|nr:non-lysosomal glucosylceramidase [Chloroflexota bacterium]
MTTVNATPAARPAPGNRENQWLSADWPVLRSYSGRKLDRLAMPVGGIGTGTISLGGRGDLRDWEIVNRPSKGFSPRHAFFAIRGAGETTDAFARCLEGPLTSGFEGWSGATVPHAGLPRFTDATFHAAYPLGQVVLTEPFLPIDVRIEAFNPLVPTDPERSGLPIVVMRFVVCNNSDEPLDISVVGALENFVGRDGVKGESTGNVNELVDSEMLAGVLMRSTGVPADSEQWGSIALSTNTGPGASITRRRDWVDKSWSAPLLDFWDDFLDDGDLDDREPAGRITPVGSVCNRQRIEAGGEGIFTFGVTWHFPNRQSWERGNTGASPPPQRVGNHYTTQYADAWDAAVRISEEMTQLEADTVDFVSAFCDSPLPAVVKEAALFNISTLRTQTAFRTEDGHFFGWEGCEDTKGSCHGSCTHVWNYEQGTAFLFGSLARSMREIEFLHATEDSGLMSFRVNLPLPYATTYGVAAADGQLGCLMKLYRDWRLCGDDEWLQRLWPSAKRALAFCWIPGGWDADRDGVMEGCQHNTMDVEYYGPNPQMQFWYLGALRSMEELARHVGEADYADDLRTLFERGKAWTDDHLFNGEYYEHEVRPARRRENVAPGLSHRAPTDEDLLEPPLQLGAGCLIDQLVGQYFAEITHLGELGSAANTRTALASIEKFNHRETMAGHFNHMRSYVLGDEAATLMCSYPLGRRPARPFPYYTEVMTGFEYTLAVHMLYVGMVDEGLALIRTIRDRYDGERRSPFNEAECGHHYARAMASWAAVLALTGFDYDASTGQMAVTLAEDNPPAFWSTGNAWGTIIQELDTVTVQVRTGTVRLESIAVNGGAPRSLEQGG